MWRQMTRLLRAGAIALVANTACAQPYPSQPIRIVVPYAAGGPTDNALRVIADRMRVDLGTVVVENRPGSGGAIAAEHVAKSPADGYTLFLAPSSLTMMAAVSKIRFDPVKDFAPISELLRLAIFLVVRSDLQVRSIPELVSYLKAHPGQVSYGSAGVGSVSHFQMEQFKALTGTDLVHIPYKSTALALTDLVAGRLQIGFDAITTSGPYIQKGTFRALAVALPQRAPQLPDVPTMAEAGLPAHDAVGWAALVAPAGTPKAVIDRLHAVVLATMRDPEVQSKLREQGVEPATSTPKEVQDRLQRETAKWALVSRKLGIKPE
jgi:tripartite-type tricarboxylate transporter receptor subunit TctC